MLLLLFHHAANSIMRIPVKMIKPTFGGFPSSSIYPVPAAVVMFSTASFSLLSSSSLLIAPHRCRRSPTGCLAPARHQSATIPSSWCRTTRPLYLFQLRTLQLISTFKVFDLLLIGLYSQCLALGRELESSGVPASVPVKVAHELLQAGHRYLDVRTPEEFGAGHASGAINIPYMYRTGSGMVKNPKFLEEVALEFRKDDEIIVGCQSGKRSMMAAADLLSAGFTGVTDIAGGYAAWAQTGLPIEA